MIQHTAGHSSSALCRSSSAHTLRKKFVFKKDPSHGNGVSRCHDLTLCFRNASPGSSPSRIESTLLRPYTESAGKQQPSAYSCTFHPNCSRRRGGEGERKEEGGRRLHARQLINSFNQRRAVPISWGCCQRWSEPIMARRGAREAFLRRGASGRNWARRWPACWTTATARMVLKEEEPRVGRVAIWCDLGYGGYDLKQRRPHAST